MTHASVVDPELGDTRHQLRVEVCYNALFQRLRRRWFCEHLGGVGLETTKIIRTSRIPEVIYR